MTIEHLRYFLTAARYLSFSRAAEELFIHQTTVSRSILGLEDELGAPLFVRMKYSLQLTELGRLLRDEAEPIVAAHGSMVEKVTNAAKGITGSLTLLTPQLYYQMLAGTYADFISSHPNIEFSVDVCPFSKMNTIAHSVLDRTVDMAITFSQNIPEDRALLRSYKICTEKQYLTVPVDHHLATRQSVKLSDIRGTEIIIADHLGKGFIQTIQSRLDTSDNKITYCKVK